MQTTTALLIKVRVTSNNNIEYFYSSLDGIQVCSKVSTQYQIHPVPIILYT